jgi:hypothetical protein
MSEKPEARAEIAKKGWLFSLDTWAVVVALLAALLVRLGVIHRVPW